MATASSASSGTVTYFTVEPPSLQTRNMGVLGIRTFLHELDVYKKKMSLAVGVTPRNVEDMLPEEVIELWLERGLIRDKSDDDLINQLKKLAGEDKGEVQRTVEEIFSGEEIAKRIYKAEYPPSARVLEMNAQVAKIIKENNLSKQLSSERAKEKLQLRLAGMIQIPRAEARIKRKIELNGGPFKPAEFDDILLSLFVEHEEYKAAKVDGSKHEEILRKEKKEDKKEDKRRAEEERKKEKVIITRSGNILQCLTCGGNHFASECPKASEADKKRSELLSAAAGHRPETRSYSSKKSNFTVSGKQKEEQDKKSGVNVLFTKEKDTTGEMCQAWIGSTRYEVEVLLDSGAGRDIISTSVLRAAFGSNVVISETEACIVQADGATQLKIVGSCTVDVLFTTGNIRVEFLVADVGVREMVIISKGTLNEYGVDVTRAFLTGIQVRHRSMVNPYKSIEVNSLTAGDANYEQMEEVLIRDEGLMDDGITENKAIDIPTIEKLFPVREIVTADDWMEIEQFYHALRDKLYDGVEAIDAPPMSVELKSQARPYHCNTRAYTPEARNWMEKTRNEMIEKGWIRERRGVGKWCSTMFPVRKPEPGQFRAVCDYVAVNKEIVVPKYPMPIQDAENDKLASSKWFGVLDAEKGYHQICLDPNASEILSLMILDRVYEPLRLFPGVASATGVFQSIMIQTVEAERDHTRVWLDDILLHHVTTKEYLKLLSRVLELLKNKRIRLNLKKSILMSDGVVFCGKQYSQQGIMFDPERVRTLRDTPIPLTAVDLMTFLCSCNWNREALPRFSEISQPLQDLLEHIYLMAGGRTKQAIRRISLAKLWKAEHTIAFEAIKARLAAEVQRDYPRDGYSLFLFTDASDKHWAAVLMQAPPTIEGEEAKKPNSQKERLKSGNLRILGFASGNFTKSSLNWDVQSKESYAVLAGLDKFKYMLVSPVTIVYDHANFTNIFGSLEPSVKKVTQSRILRMRQTLSQYSFSLLWLSGEEIPYVDYFTRNGVPLDKKDRDMVGGFTDNQIVRVSAIELIGSAFSDDFDWPDITHGDFTASIRMINSSDLVGLNNPKVEQDGERVKVNNKIFVPTKQMRLNIMITAHTCLGGHHGVDATVKAISDYFWWPKMKQDVSEFIGDCIHCIAMKKGKVKRPLGQVMIGEYPGEVVQVDHLAMSNKNKDYILVIQDTLTHFAYLAPCRSTTAEEAAQHLARYCSLFGVPRWVTTDSGAAFTSSLIKNMLEQMKIKVHVCSAYLHTGNAHVERSLRSILQVVRTVISELRIPPEEWKTCIDIVQAAINSAPRPSLGGLSAIEVFMVHQPVRPLSLIINSNTQVKQEIAELAEPRIEGMIADYVQQVEEERKAMLQTVAVQRAKVRESNDKYVMQHGGKAISAEVGDYVLLAAKKERSKLESSWIGPYVVTGVEGTHRRIIRNILTGEEESAHIGRLIQFNNKLKASQAVLKEQAGYLNEGFEVESIQGHERSGRKIWLHVRWKGFNEDDDTMEPWETIIDVAEEQVKRYVEDISDDKEKRFFMSLMKKNLGRR